mgnify:CR=1 FL=1
MLVYSLRLKDFCGFEEFSCDFSPGLNVLVGPNGSGKSSILEALNLTFYTLNVPKAPYIRANCKAATIEIDFSLSGASYSCLRTITSSGSGKVVVRKSDGEIVASGANAAKSFFDSNLNVESRGFSWYLKQAQIIDFLQIFSSTDMDKLCSLLGIGKFKNFSSEFNRVLKEFFGDVDSEYSRLDYIRKNLYNQISSLEEEREKIKISSSGISELEAKKEELIKEISKLEALKKQKALWESLTKAKQDIEFCNSKLNELDVVCTSLNSSITSLLSLPADTPLESLKAFLHELSLKIRDMRSDYEKSVRYKQLVTNSISALDKFRQRPRTCAKRLQDSLKSLAAIEARIAFYHRQDSDRVLNIHKELAASFNGVCPLCKQDISEAKAKELADELHRLNDQKLFLRQAINEYKAADKARAAIRAELASIKKSLLPYKQYVDSVSISEIESCVQVHDLVKGKISELEKLRAERNKFLQRRENQVSYVENLKNSLQVSEEQLKFPVEDNLAAALKKKVEVENQIRDCRDKQARIQVIDSKLKWLADNISVTETSLRTVAEKKDNWAKAKDACANFIEGVGEYLRYFVSGGGLLDHVNEILSDIGVIFTVRFTEVDEKYVFSARFPDGTEIHVERLSYGQRVILVVVLLFVFYITTCSSGVLLADEPTAGLDSRHLSGLSLLFNKINSLCNTYNVQCIMATHEADLISASYNVVALEKEAHI